MIHTSNEFGYQLRSKDNRKYLEYADITLSGGSKTLNLDNRNLWGGGLTVEDAVSSESSFDIGAAIINKCTVVINNIYDAYSEYDFADAKVVAWVGLELSDGTIERVRKGTYAVDEASYNGSIITLSCLDNMQKFDKPYTASLLKYPATLNAIVRDACDKCGVELQTYSFPHDDFIVQERPNDEAVTFREIISWCAQIAGCFCRCDTLGRLELKWYDQELLEATSLDGGHFDKENPYQSGDNADGGSFNPWNTGYEFDAGTFKELNNIHNIQSNYSIDISMDDVVITGVKVLEKTKENDKDAIVTYQSGKEGYVISIENNKLIKGGKGQQISNWLGQQLIGFRFRRINVSHASDPTIEAGDVGFLTDRKGNVYRMVVSSTKFSTGSSQTTISSAQNPLRNSAARFSAETKNYVDYRKDIEKERTDREKALESLKDRIDNSSGLFTTEVTQPDGSSIFYMHDKPTLDESMIVWKMTAEAWGVSTDGGKTYNAGMTVDGDTIVRILTAVGVNADWIKTGAFRVEKNGKTMVNMDIDTGVVDIVADSFSLSSGHTIGDIAQGAVDAQTQTDIFNKLTNNGKSEGIYLENGNLYVNASYIKSGEFVLGGANNKNGTLSIRNSDDEEIGRWDNGGIYAYEGEIYSKTPATGASIRGGRTYLSYGDLEIGHIGTNQWHDYNPYKGIVFDLENAGAYMAWGVKENAQDQVYTTKFWYMNKPNGDLKKDTLYVGCDMDFRNYAIKNSYIDGLRIKKSLLIPNNTECDVYSHVDFHNFELQNAKINNLVSINGYTPYSGNVSIIKNIQNNGDGTITWYPGVLLINDGIITGIS